MAGFSRLFRNRSRRIKRVAEYDIQQGEVPIAPIRSVDISRSEEGSIDRIIVVEHRYFETCGCSATDLPAGGRCQVCEGVACALHWYLCGRCGRGLCSRHAQARADVPGDAHLCPECALWTAPVRGLARTLALLRGG